MGEYFMDCVGVWSLLIQRRDRAKIGDCFKYWSFWGCERGSEREK